MLRKEWSLIVNSLMLQLAAGMFTFLAVYRLILTGTAGSEEAITLTAPGFTLTGPVILTGMIASLFHLGSPARAYRSVFNIGTSWLSREIFFTGVFFALWLFTYFMEMRGNEIPFLMWLTAVIGLLGVLSMAYIYYSTGKPGWFSSNTFTGFFGTTLIFGCVSSTLILYNSSVTEKNINTLLLIPMLLALLILIIRFATQFKLFSSLTTTSGKKEFSIDNLVSAPSLTEKSAALYKSLTVWGLGFSTLGVCLSLVILFNVTTGAGNLMLAVSAVVVAIGELLGRSGFYSLGLHEEA